MNGFVKFPVLASVLIAVWCGTAFWPTHPAMGDGPVFSAAQNGANSDDGSRPLTPPNRPLRTPNAKTGKKPQPPGSAGALWKTFSLLAVLIIVIIVGAKFLKKHGPRLPGGIPADAMEVLGKRTIDRGQLIYLIRLGSRILIIGSSSGGLQTLGEVTDPVEIDFLAGLCRQKSETSSNIAQGFLALFNRQQFDSVPQHAEESQPSTVQTESHADPFVSSYNGTTTASHEEHHA